MNIIELAKQAGATYSSNPDEYDVLKITNSELQAFAALVEAAARADEREECAKVCDEHGFYGVSPAAAIRARGTT